MIERISGVMYNVLLEDSIRQGLIRSHINQMKSRTDSSMKTSPRNSTLPVDIFLNEFGLKVNEPLTEPPVLTTPETEPMGSPAAAVLDEPSQPANPEQARRTAPGASVRLFQKSVKSVPIPMSRRLQQNQRRRLKFHRNLLFLQMLRMILLCGLT